MKKILVLIFVFTLSNAFAQKDEGDWHWDYCNDFEGPDAVRLKVTLHYLWYFMDPPDNTMDSEYDNIFTNAQACSKYFQREFAEYPYDKKGDVRVDIDIHYHCAPCAAHNKKKKEDESKKKYSIGSRKHNRGIAESAKSCFNGNEDSYNDFLNSLGNIADNVYLDELTCKNGKLFPVWSKHDSKGKQIPLTENDRKTVDDFYKDMRGKSKAREVNKLAQQLKRAQTVKEASELINTLKDLFTSKNNDFKSDLHLNPKNANEQSLQLDNGILSSEQYKSGTRELILDSDNDGYADTKATIRQGEAPVYQSINGGELDEAGKLQDFYNKFAMMPYRPDADSKITYPETLDWWQNGGGQDLYVDLGKVDLYKIKPQDFPSGIGSTQQFNLLDYSNLNDGMVYGTITLKYLGDNKVSSIGNTYNFDPKSGGSIIREAETWLGGKIAGHGSEFTIYFFGTGKINGTPVWRK